MNKEITNSTDIQEANAEDLDLFADEIEDRGNALAAPSSISTAASISTSACLG